LGRATVGVGSQRKALLRTSTNTRNIKKGIERAKKSGVPGQGGSFGKREKGT